MCRKTPLGASTCCMHTLQSCMVGFTKNACMRLQHASITDGSPTQDGQEHKLARAPRRRRTGHPAPRQPHTQRPWPCSTAQSAPRSPPPPCTPHAQGDSSAVRLLRPSAAGVSSAEMLAITHITAGLPSQEPATRSIQEGCAPVLWVCKVPQEGPQVGAPARVLHPKHAFVRRPPQVPAHSATTALPSAQPDHALQTPCHAPHALLGTGRCLPCCELHSWRLVV